MRIVIDLQGAQSESSRNRGIGRYSLSLAKAMVANRGSHEIIIALNAFFSEATDEIYNEFAALLPLENIVTWSAPVPVYFMDEENRLRREVAEKIRESFLSSLHPDIVLVSSLFEGYGDNSVTSIGTFCHIPTAVILYDLIPLIHAGHYLQDPSLKAWYMTKIASLKEADLLLSISESAKQEAHDYLNVNEKNIANISTAADVHFQYRNPEDLSGKEIRSSYGIHDKFIMYTGGVDYRKNIEGLIEAYALLPDTLKSIYQLAVVCSMSERDKTRLFALADDFGLPHDRMVFTGFIPDDDLIWLYNICDLFVFPSWHEGFGLPALEAMLCGAVVIGSNVSSLPEVIGLEEALFDPKDVHSIADKLEEALTDEDFRKRLRSHAAVQVRKFTWNATASAALKTLEERVAELKYISSTKGEKISGKPTLAYLSPLPPERSGISDYSAALLPFLDAYYTVDIVTDQQNIADAYIAENHTVKSVSEFKKCSRSYDRILYHFGNSHFHRHMFGLLEEIPGIVVLHDFFLSGVSAYIDFNGYEPNFWPLNLYRSHGYAALKAYFGTEGHEAVMKQYPASLPVLQNALGVIVHSDYSVELRDEWYGKTELPWPVIPLLRLETDEYSKEEAKASLGFSKDAFVICCFGLLHQNKLNHRLLKAYLASGLSENPECYLVFVGESKGSKYAGELQAAIEESGVSEQIFVTDWVEEGTFKTYLQVADIGVQLRANSRGESSAAVLDCMNYGLATIVNANGAMADLPQDAVLMLPDTFSDNVLTKALERLYEEEETRERLGRRAKEIIRQKHNPKICAARYAEEIETIYSRKADKLYGLMQALPETVVPWSEDEVKGLSVHLARNFPPEPRQKEIFVDISALFREESSLSAKKKMEDFLKEVLGSSLPGYRVEPVYLTKDAPCYSYARERTAELLEIPEGLLHDEPVTGYPGDIYVALDPDSYAAGKLKLLRQRGVAFFLSIPGFQEKSGERLNAMMKELPFFDIVAAADVKEQEKAKERTAAEKILTAESMTGGLAYFFRILEKYA